MKNPEKATSPLQRNLLRILAVTAASWNLPRGQDTPLRKAIPIPLKAQNRLRNIPWSGYSGPRPNLACHFCE